MSLVKRTPRNKLSLRDKTIAVLDSIESLISRLEKKYKIKIIYNVDSVENGRE